MIISRDVWNTNQACKIRAKLSLKVSNSQSLALTKALCKFLASTLPPSPQKQSFKSEKVSVQSCNAWSFETEGSQIYSNRFVYRQDIDSKIILRRLQPFSPDCLEVQGRFNRKINQYLRNLRKHCQYDKFQHNWSSRRSGKLLGIN